MIQLHDPLLFSGWWVNQKLEEADCVDNPTVIEVKTPTTPMYIYFNTQKDNYVVFKKVQKEKIENSKPTRLQKSVCLSKDSLLCRGHLEWGETKTKLAKG